MNIEIRGNAEVAADQIKHTPYGRIMIAFDDLPLGKTIEITDISMAEAREIWKKLHDAEVLLNATDYDIHIDVKRAPHATGKPSAKDPAILYLAKHHRKPIVIKTGRMAYRRRIKELADQLRECQETRSNPDG